MVMIQQIVIISEIKVNTIALQTIVFGKTILVDEAKSWFNANCRVDLYRQKMIMIILM